MKNLLFRRRFSLVAALLLFASTSAYAAPAVAPAAVAPAAATDVAPTDDVTILPETESADASVLPGIKTALTPQQRRARAAMRRRQSEEKLLELLKDVGGDVPQLRDALRDYFKQEARARRPLLDQGNLILATLRLGVSDENVTTPEKAMRKLHDALRLESPDATPVQNSASLEGEMRVSLSQQKTAVATPDEAATPDAAATNDADRLRVLAEQDNAQLRALVATMRQMQAEERAQRDAREAQLDAKLHFRDNPRLEATLLLLGIIGDSGYTVSVKVLSPAPAASTRAVTDNAPNAAPPK